MGWGPLVMLSEGSTGICEMRPHILTHILQQMGLREGGRPRKQRGYSRRGHGHQENLLSIIMTESCIVDHYYDKIVHNYTPHSLWPN